MNTWKTSLALTAYVLATLAVALPLGAFNHYVLCENATNHTGASPYALFVVFVPAAVISIRMLQPNDRKWILPLVLAAAGSVNVLAFDAFHVMQEYGSWIQSGMPERPTWTLQACGGKCASGCRGSGRCRCRNVRGKPGAAQTPLPIPSRPSR